MGYYQDLDEDRGADAEVARWERECGLLNAVKHVSPSEYAIAKAAAVGTRVVCAGCSKPFLKRSCQQAFCRNKGRGNCKDRYWNVVAPRGLKAGAI